MPIPWAQFQGIGRLGARQTQVLRCQQPDTQETPMFVRPKPAPLDLLFAVRGTSLPHVWGRLLVLACVAVGAVLASHAHPGGFAQIGAFPFTLIGLALSIFMSFRNNTAYARWWEARQYWGALITACRSLARQTQGLPQADRTRLLHAACGFAGTLAARLRGNDEVAAAAPWLTPTGHPVPATTVLDTMGAQCLDLLAQGAIDPIRWQALDGQIGALTGIQAACERIANTPVPFAYSLLLHRTAHIFCLTLPFALAGSLGWGTVLATVLVGYTFFGLDALGDQIEEPFGTEPNDLPLLAMVRQVERDMLAALGHTDLPPALLPHDQILL
jgi:putative membrane protein